MMNLDAIADSFTGLLKDHHYSKITIQMICEKTPVSRNAFYYHFKNKEHLTEWICSRDYMKYSYPYFQIDTDNIKSRSIFLYIKKHKSYYTAIYHADDGQLLHHCLSKAYSDGVMKDKIEEYAQHLLHRTNSGIQVRMNINHFRFYLSSGLAAVVLSWIKDDMKIPIEDMAEDVDILLKKSPEDIVSYHLF